MLLLVSRLCLAPCLKKPALLPSRYQGSCPSVLTHHLLGLAPQDQTRSLPPSPFFASMFLIFQTQQPFHNAWNLLCVCLSGRVWSQSLLALSPVPVPKCTRAHTHTHTNSHTQLTLSLANSYLPFRFTHMSQLIILTETSFSRPLPPEGQSLSEVHSTSPPSFHSAVLLCNNISDDLSATPRKTRLLWGSAGGLHISNISTQHQVYFIVNNVYWWPPPLSGSKLEHKRVRTFFVLFSAVDSA